MSAIYTRRIKIIQNELLATQGALKRAARDWQKNALFNDIELEGVGPQDIKNALHNLETTYIIRLFAAFEGMLKEHLAQRHPGIAVPEDARAIWLIDRVAALQTPPIGAPLRQRVHDVRKYRNVLAHGNPVALPRLLFSEARSRLSTYLSKLPDPYD